MTKKLYDDDSHIQSFQAKVIDCLPGKKGYKVELDQTAFFAEGGGQPADRGILAGSCVFDVQEESGHIYHYIEKPLELGEMVDGEIDWPFRYDYMQQHSGEHILSGLVYAWKGYHNVGFHMNESLTTIDFDGVLTRQELIELELQANRVIYENQPIFITYPSQEELEQIDYRSKKKLTGAVRIVKLGESDCCACCAPHVRYTGEIGQIKIIGAENYKGGVRLTIVCGERALADYEGKNDLLKKLGAQLSVKAENIAVAVEKQIAELRELKNKQAELAAELIRCRVALLQETECVCLVEKQLDAVAARNLVNVLADKLTKHAAILLPKQGEAEEYQYMICSRTEDVRPFAKALAEKFGGRGGGSVQMVQGTVKGQAVAIAAFLKQV